MILYEGFPGKCLDFHTIYLVLLAMSDTLILRVEKTLVRDIATRNSIATNLRQAKEKGLAISS